MFPECYLSEVSLREHLNVEPEGEWNPVNYLMLMREQQLQEALWGLPNVDPRCHTYQIFGEA